MRKVEFAEFLQDEIREEIPDSVKGNACSGT